jgi:hypothetical protein
MNTATQFLQQNSIGAIIELTVMEDEAAVDISAATTKQFVFRKPDGSLVTKTASFSGSGADGKLRYSTDTAFLDQPGTWRVQASLVFTGFTGRTEAEPFSVRPNL